MYRVRPREPNDDARSDEDFGDEQIVLTEEALERAMKTRVGGRVTETNMERVRSIQTKQHNRTHIAAACN